MEDFWAGFLEFYAGFFSIQDMNMFGWACGMLSMTFLMICFVLFLTKPRD